MALSETPSSRVPGNRRHLPSSVGGRLGTTLQVSFTLCQQQWCPWVNGRAGKRGAVRELSPGLDAESPRSVRISYQMLLTAASLSFCQNGT